MSTPHREDFIDAHRRCWEDAELLFDNERWASADQMYGFSAECGLKTVLEKFDDKFFKEDGRPENRYRKHVQNLWPEFEDFARGHSGGAQYLEIFPADRPFSDWSHHNRYANRRHFNEESVKPHRLAARKITEMVEFAQESIPP